MRNLYPLVLALLGLSISGCFSDSGDPGPDPDTGSTGFEEVIGITPGDVPTGFYAAWDPSSGITPYPNDILGFLADPPTDGTLNLSTNAAFQLAASSSFGAPLNDIDGFSVFSRIQANFSEAVDESTLNPLSVFLLEVALDPATRGVIGLSDETLCKLGLAPQPARRYPLDTLAKLQWVLGQTEASLKTAETLAAENPSEPGYRAAVDSLRALLGASD